MRRSNRNSEAFFADLARQYGEDFIRRWRQYATEARQRDKEARYEVHETQT